MKKIDGFWAGTEAYKKNRENLALQNHYRKVREDLFKKLLAVRPPKGFNGLLSDMAR